MFRLAASTVTFAPCGVGLCGIRSSQELEPSYPETSSLSWSWLTFRVLTTDLPALPPQTLLPRQRGKYEQSAPPMNVWRSFDVYQQAAATSTGYSTTRLCSARDLGYRQADPGPRRVTPPQAYPPYFRRERPWTSKSTKRFPLR